MIRLTPHRRLLLAAVTAASLVLPSFGLALSSTESAAGASIARLDPGPGSAAEPAVRQAAAVEIVPLGAAVPGKPLEVEIRAMNATGVTGPGGLTVMLSGIDAFDIVSSTSPGATKSYGVGEPMYNFAQGGNVPNRAPAVEVFLNPWPAGDRQTLRLRIAATDASYTLQARATVRTPNGFIFEPSRGPLDQQGAPTHALEIALPQSAPPTPVSPPTATRRSATATPAPPTATAVPPTATHPAAATTALPATSAPVVAVNPTALPRATAVPRGTGPGQTTAPGTAPTSVPAGSASDGVNLSLPLLLGGLGIIGLGIAIGLAALVLVTRRRDTARPYPGTDPRTGWPAAPVYPPGVYPPGIVPPDTARTGGYGQTSQMDAAGVPPSAPPGSAPHQDAPPWGRPTASTSPAGNWPVDEVRSPWEQAPSTGGQGGSVVEPSRRSDVRPEAATPGPSVPAGGMSAGTVPPMGTPAEPAPGTGLAPASTELQGGLVDYGAAGAPPSQPRRLSGPYPDDERTPHPGLGVPSGSAVPPLDNSRYQQRTLVARGGMGRVYKAYDSRLRRWVALKVMHADLSDQPEFVARFVREAQVAAMLAHPNIVTIHDIDQTPDNVQMVMAWIEGEDLQHILEREGPLPLDRAARILDQVAVALDHAHNQQPPVLHRDVKPSNVMVGKHDRVVLTDFGIARLVGDRTLTQAGQLVGTPTFMAPEVVQGSEADRRSDVYALGVVLYQMVTGRVPFRAETPLAVLHAQVHTPPPVPHTLMPNLPSTVDQVLMMALAKDPNQRYQGAGELARAFRAAIAELPA
ncbi:MAG: protein kinase [Chloroflexi bacterium]|nr:protein kinase [Chloroflexota bacterium]